MFNVFTKVGLVTANEHYSDIRPKYQPYGSKNGVMFVHGAGSISTFPLDNAYNLGSWGNFVNSIADEGYVMGSSDNGGDSWGNSDSTTKLDAAVNYLRSRPGVNPTGKVALVIGSMGGIVSINYALANPSKVSCIVGIIPVINPEDIRANNRSGYAASINAAFGGNYVESTYGATRNPYTFRNASNIANIPMLFYYGSSDTLCLPTYTQSFAAAAPTKRTLVALSSGHDFDSYANANRNNMLNFIITNNVG